MTSVKNSNILINSRARDVINSVRLEKQVTDDEWIQLTTLAAQHGKNNELHRLRELESLLKEDKRQEAGQIWSRLRGFFESCKSLLPPVANIAQVIATIDELMRHS